MADLILEVSQQAQNEFIGFLELFEGISVKLPEIAPILPKECNRLPPQLEYKPGISNARIQDQYKSVTSTLSRLVNLCNEHLHQAETDDDTSLISVQSGLQCAHGIYLTASLLSRLSVSNSQINDLVIEVQETNDRLLGLVMPEALMTQKLLASKDLKYANMYKQEYTIYHDSVMDTVDTRYKLQAKLRDITSNQNIKLIDQSEAYGLALDVDFVQNCQVAEQAIISHYSRAKDVAFLLSDSITEKGIRDILHLLAAAEPEVDATGNLSQGLADFKIAGALTQTGCDAISCTEILADKSSDIASLKSQLLDWQIKYDEQKQQKDHVGTAGFDAILCHGSLLIADAEEMLKR